MAEKPNFTLRQVGRRMRTLRENAGHTLRSVVDAGVTRNKDRLSRMELGQQTTLEYANIRELARFYGASEELQAALVDWYQKADRATGEEFTGAVVRDFHRLIEMEGYVDDLCIYEPNLIPGLAQTERYARSAHERDPELDEETIERSLAARMTRQAQFNRRSPLPTTRILLGEQALRGGCDREQISRLKEMSSGPSIDIRVLPLDNGPYPRLRGPFVLLRFDAEEDPDCVYTEGLEGSRYDVKPENVHAYDRLFKAEFEQGRPLEEF